MRFFFHLALLTLIVTVISQIPIFNANAFNIKQAVLAVYEYTGYGGTGANGALTVNGIPNGPTNPLYTDNTRTYLTAAASSGGTVLTVPSSTGFSAGNEVVIIQMLGSGTGNYETKTISSTTGTTITLSSALTNSYPAYSAGTAVTQVILVPQYTSITINSGGFLTVHAFDGQTGGVMFVRANSGVNLVYNATLSGTLSVRSKGYSGGAIGSAGSGPGGGAVGAGGTNMSPGSTLQAILGAGGGGSASAAGGAGGGIIILKTSGTVTLDGNIDAYGGAAGGTNAAGGAGGTIQITADTITRTSTCGTLSATGGSGNGSGTAGGDGRVFIHFASSNACVNATPDGSTTYRRFYVR